MSEDTINRRKVVQGIAWTAPTIVATVAAPMAAASPTLCDLEDLWRNGRSEDSFVTLIDAEGVITIEKPATWVAEWNPTVTVSYNDTDATATIKRDGDVVTATPPAGVNPFDIKRIDYYPAPWTYRYLTRSTDENGSLTCALEASGWDMQ